MYILSEDAGTIINTERACMLNVVGIGEKKCDWYIMAYNDTGDRNPVGIGYSSKAEAKAAMLYIFEAMKHRECVLDMNDYFQNKTLQKKMLEEIVGPVK